MKCVTRILTSKCKLVAFGLGMFWDEFGTYALLWKHPAGSSFFAKNNIPQFFGHDQFSKK